MLCPNIQKKKKTLNDFYGPTLRFSSYVQLRLYCIVFHDVRHEWTFNRTQEHIKRIDMVTIARSNSNNNQNKYEFHKKTNNRRITGTLCLWKLENAPLFIIDGGVHCCCSYSVKFDALLILCYCCWCRCFVLKCSIGEWRASERENGFWWANLTYYLLLLWKNILLDENCFELEINCGRKGEVGWMSVEYSYIVTMWRSNSNMNDLWLIGLAWEWLRGRKEWVIDFYIVCTSRKHSISIIYY